MATKRSFSRPPALPTTLAGTPYVPAILPTDYVRPVAKPTLAYNGMMQLWQRGTSLTGIVSGSGSNYLADRFQFSLVSGNGTPAVMSYTQVTDAPTSGQTDGVALKYSAQAKVTTAAGGMAAGDFCRFYQWWEGYDARVFATSPTTLSFWVKASVAGTYCVCFSAVDATGLFTWFYCVEYSITNASVWQKVVMTVPGAPNFGSPSGVETSLSYYIQWVMAAGSTFNVMTPNVFLPNVQMATANQTNMITTLNATFQLTGVKFEQGVIATPLPYIPIQQELAKCQRYCFVFKPGAANILVGNATVISNANLRMVTKLPVTMRAAPTLSYLGGAGNDFNMTNGVLAVASSALATGGGNGTDWLDHSITIAASGSYAAAQSAIVYTSGAANAGFQATAEV